MRAGFEIFELARADKVAQAIVDTLAAEPAIADWSGGRIHRLAVDAPPLGDLWNAEGTIGVAALQESERTIAGAVELTVVSLISVFYEQMIGTLDDGEPSSASLVQAIKVALVRNYYLKVPRYEDERLVKRLHLFQTVDVLPRKGQEGAVETVTLLQVEHQVDLDPKTREKLP